MQQHSLHSAKPCHCDVIDVFRYTMNWFTIGQEDGDKRTKPFMGIGPDNLKAMRGSTMQWPFYCDGSINYGYVSIVNMLEEEKKRVERRVKKTHEALDKMMDEVIAGTRSMPTPDEFAVEMGKDLDMMVMRNWTKSLLQILVEELKRQIGPV